MTSTRIDLTGKNCDFSAVSFFHMWALFLDFEGKKLNSKGREKHDTWKWNFEEVSKWNVAAHSSQSKVFRLSGSTCTNSMLGSGAPNVCEIIQQQCPNMIKVWSSLHLHSISYLKPGAAFENTPNSISFELVLRLFWGLSIKDGLIMSETYISDWTNENTFGWYINICSRVFRVLCLYFVSILYSWVGHLQIAGNRSAHAALSINLSPPFLQRSCRKHWSKTFGHRLHNQHHYHSRSHLVKMKRSSWYVVMLHQVVTVSQWPKTN